MMGAIGLIDNEDMEEIEKKDEEDIEEDLIEPEILTARKNKIVSIKTNSAPKVLLKKPTNGEDIPEIIDAVKSRKIVIMNITEVEPSEARRMVDYMLGATYALNANMEIISNSIFIITPENVEVTNELKQELSRSGFFSFTDR